MQRRELAKVIAYARIEVGMSREEFMRQTPREWAEIIALLYNRLSPEQKALLPQNNDPQTPEEMMKSMSSLGG